MNTPESLWDRMMQLKGNGMFKVIEMVPTKYDEKPPRGVHDVGRSQLSSFKEVPQDLLDKIADRISELEKS